MPTVTRTFRVFVSSTFEDLKDERNILQAEVFPKLEQLCLEKGARFQAVDLRWGVREEAGLDHKTMEICLAEIARCQKTGIRPNFIVLLGDRYGWRPLPSRVKKDEFETLLPHVSPGERKLLAFIEGEPAETNGWYRLDWNADPPEYLLLPRGESYRAQSQWEPIETRMREALRNAARAASLPEEERHKYDDSATHQEILAGLGKTNEDRAHVFAFVRNPDGPKDRDLERLLNELRGKLPKENLIGFSASDLAQLCQRVKKCLTTVIETEVSSFQTRTPLQQEQDAHKTFAEDRAKHFVGRGTVRGAIQDYLRGSDPKPLVVDGPSGSGKSSILAKESEEHPGIRRFIGVTPASSSGLTLLRSLCEEIGERYAQTEGPPATFNEVVVMFQDRLRLATAERPLTLYMDALDQLQSQDPAAAINWLPRELPPHCRIVLSTIEVPPALAGAKSVPVAPFSMEEAEATLAELLTGASRTLQGDGQRDKLLESFRPTGSPLYLKLAFEEARLWRSFDPLNRCVLGEGLPGIIDRLFARLSDPTNHGEVLVGHALGYLTAARYGLTEDDILAVLAADDVVWDDFQRAKKHDLPAAMATETESTKRRLPVIVWSRLYLDLEPYLTERAVPGGITISFYHRQLAEKAPAEQSHYTSLARYFGRQSNWLGPQHANERRITELVHQQIGGELWGEVEATLTELDFVCAKCAAALVFDLQEDYREAITALPEAQPELRKKADRQVALANWTQTLINCAGEKRLPKAEEIIRSAEPWTDEQIAAESKRIVENPTHLDRLKAFAKFVEQEFYPLLDFGKRVGFVVQHAFNQAPDGAVHNTAAVRLADASATEVLRVWPRNADYNPMPAQLRMLEGHTDTVHSASITEDGRRAVSTSSDNTLRVWDLETGECLRVLEGHTDTVYSVSVTPDGRRGTSASRDKTLRVWDLETGECMGVLEGHAGWVLSVSVTPDGQRAVSASTDYTLRVWDLSAGECVRVLEGHRDGVSSVSVTPDGRHAVSTSDDRTLRMWDLESGKCMRVLEGHIDAVSSVSLTPDGRRAISAGWSSDKTLRVWNLETAECVQVLEGHTDLISSVSVTADGRRAVSVSHDKTLRMWDLETGECRLELRGHTGHISSVSMTADGRRAVSASNDKTLRVWDLETGACLQVADGHTKGIWSVKVTRDRRAVSASHDRTLRVWDLDTGSCLRVLKAHTAPVRIVIVTPDNRRAVSACAVSGERALRVWDLETGACLCVLEGHTDAVNSLSVTPDGRRVVSASDDRTLRVWDLESWACLHVLHGHIGLVNDVCVTPDNWRAVSAGDKTLRVWDLETGACLRVLELNGNDIESVKVTPDGRRAISTSFNGGWSLDPTLRVWDVETGVCIQVLEGHTAPVESVSVTLDGRYAISGSEDETLRVWDLESGECLRVLEGHTAPVCSVSVTPDRRLVVSGSRDRTLRMWDLETGQCFVVVRLNAPCQTVDAHSPNCIVAGTSSGEVLCFEIRDLNISLTPTSR